MIYNQLLLKLVLTMLNTCCTLACLSGVITAIVFCVIFAVQGQDQMSFSYHLWFWNVIYGGVLTVSVINSLVKLIFPQFFRIEVPNNESTKDKTKRYVKTYVYNYNNPMDSVIALAAFGMYIWAIYIMAHIGLDGGPYNHSLYTWFSVMFWYATAWMLIYALVILIFIVIWCVAGVAILSTA